MATCDPHHIAITPTAIIKRESLLKDCTKIIDIMIAKNIVLVVVGMPFAETNIANHILDFSNFLHRQILAEIKSANLILISEDLSSFEARRINRENFYLHRQKKYQKQHKFYDDIASAVILQYFFEILGE